MEASKWIIGMMFGMLNLILGNSDVCASMFFHCHISCFTITLVTSIAYVLHAKSVPNHGGREAWTTVLPNIRRAPDRHGATYKQIEAICGQVAKKAAEALQAKIFWKSLHSTAS